jgi:iron complex outermembrane receptor protein
MSRGLFASAGAAAVLALTPLGGAHAQASGDSRIAALEEVVVTARKREENLQTTPVAVSALTAQSIERNRVLRIDDLQKSTPSLVIFANPGLIGTATYSLRGLQASDFIPTNENPVAIYVDGVYVARNIGSLFNLTDMERVEVLRGPQGTINGRNATAGSIALYTKGPADHFHVQQKFTYGTYSDWTSRTTLDTGELGATGLTARLAFYHHQTDGYIRNTTTSKSKSPGALKNNAGFFALHGEWGDFRMDYKYDISDVIGIGQAQQLATATPTFLSFMQTYNPGFRLYPHFEKKLAIKSWGPSKDNAQGHSLNLRYDLTPDIQLKSISGFRMISAQYASLTGTYPQLFGNVSPTGAAPFSIQPIDISIISNIIIKQRQWSQEFQLTGKTGRFSYVAGLYYFKERSLESYHDQGSRSIVVLSPTTGQFGNRSFLDFVNYATSKAAYGQVSYTPPILDDKLELTVGGRYTKDHKHLIQTNPKPGTALIPIPRDVARSFHNFSAEGSIKYQWTPDAMTYFRVAQAYRAGGISARDVTFAPNGYEPEKLISYELGLKADFLDRHVRLNADVYHSKYKNLQVVQSFTRPACTSSSICSTTVNAGAARYNGVEAELTAVPTRGLEIAGHIGYIDPKYKSFIINQNVGDIADAPGTVFAYMSKLTAGASAQYAFEPTAWGELSARVAWNYHSKRYFGNQILPTNFTEALKDPGFHEVSAQIVLADIPMSGFPGKLTASVYGANLLGKHEVLQAIDISQYGIRAWGPGRTFGVSLTGDF